MFRKFQELTIKFIFGSGSNDSLFLAFYVMLIIAEAVSVISCGVKIQEIGLTNLTVPWGISVLAFWFSFILLMCQDDTEFRLSSRNYEKLNIDEKRRIFKLSIILFVNLLTCGLMLFIIIAVVSGSIIDRISRHVIPDKPEKKSGRKLADQFETLIEDR